MWIKNLKIIKLLLRSQIFALVAHHISYPLCYPIKREQIVGEYKNLKYVHIYRQCQHIMPQTALTVGKVLKKSGANWFSEDVLIIIFA